MTAYFSPLIKPNELIEVKKSGDFVLIDACFGREKYLESHLEGALHVDLNSELSDIQEDVAIGGRHPLPEPDVFCQLLANLGISPSSHVVVYDDKSGSNAAARFWWMLKALGHEKIQVVDGGKDAAIKSGYPVKSGLETAKKEGFYPVKPWSLPLANIEELDKASRNEKIVIIDVRETERYLGKKEPIDLIAGHIPGAINIPFMDNLDENGNFHSPELLKRQYSNVLKDKDPQIS
jgi:thiosulfate/3-mercaptopyruvate sulfurtransferase